MKFSEIESLPDNFTFNGNLSLSHTKLTALPKGLVVKGVLHLMDSPLANIELPDDLVADGVEPHDTLARYRNKKELRDKAEREKL